MSLFLEDVQRLEYPKGLLLNPAVIATCSQHPQLEPSLCPLGAKFTLLRDEFRDVASSQLNETVQNIIVPDSGQDSRNSGARILYLLRDTRPQLHKQILVPTAFCNLATLKEAADKNTEFVFSVNTAKMHALMQRTDVAISASGQTLNELISCGVPTIAFELAENQKLILEGWQKAGAVLSAGSDEADAFQPLLDRHLQTLRSKEERVRRIAGGRELLDGKGADRVIELRVSKFQPEAGQPRRPALF